ncbi:MAG: ribonuclease HII [Candidatus Omnitrophota bacterium]|nr:ribonuclease HII [Candidatus Omnitrophota bacterium]MDD5137509.1 ribonuclease HII [Candidatus Omnitrophota bacterium]
MGRDFQVLYHERRAKKDGYSVIVGVDEAGRGPLAGPVVVAAVILKTYAFASRIDDSKKLTGRQRRTAFDEILVKSTYGVGIMNQGVIDSVNISAATHFAVDEAVARLMERFRIPPKRKSVILLLDGRLRSHLSYHAKEIIGGDGLSLSIAAASIVAKVIRDRIMEIYDRIYPQYGFSRHKGYGTAEHLDRVNTCGLSPLHRRTFCHHIPCPS